MRAARSIAGRRLAGLALAALGAVLAPASSFPCDSTCCLMLTRGTSGLMGRGGFQIDLSYRYTDMSTRLEGTEPTDSVIRPKVLLETGWIIPGYHEDREGTESFLQLDAAWGVGSATTVFASWPVLTHKYYVIGHGGVQTTYNIRGVGDPVVGARQAFFRGPGHMLVASLGIQLPLGADDRIDEFDQTVLDPTMQPGTGSGDLITALQWTSRRPGPDGDHALGDLPGQHGQLVRVPVRQPGDRRGHGGPAGGPVDAVAAGEALQPGPTASSTAPPSPRRGPRSST